MYTRILYTEGFCFWSEVKKETNKDWNTISIIIIELPCPSHFWFRKLACAIRAHSNAIRAHPIGIRSDTVGKIGEHAGRKLKHAYTRTTRYIHILNKRCADEGWYVYNNNNNTFNCECRGMWYTHARAAVTTERTIERCTVEPSHGRVHYYVHTGRPIAHARIRIRGFRPSTGSPFPTMCPPPFTYALCSCVQLARAPASYGERCGNNARIVSRLSPHVATSAVSRSVLCAWDSAGFRRAVFFRARFSVPPRFPYK